MTLITRVSGRLDALCGPNFPETLGIAVSGGGDSLALLYLTAAWAQTRSVCLVALTVDHGLRTESAQEAAYVAELAAKLNIPHHSLAWSGWDRRGNLQDMARQARRKLIEGACKTEGITTVLTGHTADDQAETVLMRLARGSGVDGLAGMAEVEHHGLRWIRPLLRERREALRDHLRALDVGWVDDPSNEDPRFDRVRARQMLGHLSELGLTSDRLIQTAEHMQAAQRSLWQASVAFAKAHVVEDRGDLILSPSVLKLERGDTERRVFAQAIGWVSGAANRPRFTALAHSAETLRQGKRITLQGVLMTPEAENIRLSREYSAVIKAHSVIDHGSGETVWDGRWCIQNSDQCEVKGVFTVRSLGEDGLAACKNWRDSELPRASLLASPSVWANGTLISAPLVENANGWAAFIPTNFADSLLSH